MTREEMIKRLWEKDCKTVLQDWKDHTDEQLALGFFELGWRAADENPPKGTSLIKWQTGEPKNRGSYIVTYRHDSKDHITALYFVGGSWLSGDYDEIPKEKIIAWCKLSDIEPYKEE